MTVGLYPHQTKWANDIAAKFSTHQSVMGQLPTGAGKTVCLAFMARKCQEAGMRVMIAVHRQEIFLQTSQHLLEAGIYHDFIGSSEVRNMASLSAAKEGHLWTQGRNNVFLASLPTLMRRERFPRLDYLFIDEAHHAAAKTWAEVITTYAHAGTKILGVTATPERHDGIPLYPMFQSLVMGPSMRELIRDGYLSPFEIKCPVEQVSREGIKVRGGEYDTKQLAPRARVIVGSAIEQYRKYLDGQKCIVFVPSVDEAKRTADDFCAAGYRAVNIDGRMKEKERRDRIRGLSTGDFQLLVNDSVLSEGLDVPNVSGLISLRPTFSRSRWMQDVGRALRYVPGKIALILDHANNSSFHGNPMDITEFGFFGDPDYKPKEEKEREDMGVHFAVRHCDNCLQPYISSVNTCPYCGHEFVSAKRKYQQVDGELVDANREEPPEIQAAKAVALLWATNQSADGIDAVAEQYGLDGEWVAGMRDRIRWWETPIGSENIA